METRELIAPLSGAGRAGEIAARLTEAIHLGLLADGEHLPPEPEFAQQLGVATMTLRDAISVLREQGLVETRRGRHGGTFVKRSLEPPPGPDTERLRAMAAGTLRDIADEQLAITGVAARLAAERAPARGVRRILSFVDQLGAAGTRGERMRADSRFHIEVAIATRSERLVRREVALQAETAGLLWLPRPVTAGGTGAGDDDAGDDAGGGAGDAEEAVREHHEIAAAIAAEDAEGAQRAAERHVRRNLRRLTSGYLHLIEESAEAGGEPGGTE